MLDTLTVSVGAVGFFFGIFVGSAVLTRYAISGYALYPFIVTSVGVFSGIVWIFGLFGMQVIVEWWMANMPMPQLLLGMVLGSLITVVIMRIINPPAPRVKARRTFKLPQMRTKKAVVTSNSQAVPIPQDWGYRNRSIE